MSIIQALPFKDSTTLRPGPQMGTEYLMHESIRGISDFNHDAHVSVAMKKWVFIFQDKIFRV